MPPVGAFRTLASTARVTTRAGWLLVIAAALGCQAPDRGRAHQVAADSEPARASEPLAANRLYVGISLDRQGWLLRLDFEAGDGVMYAPEGATELCGLRVDATGNVEFGSPTVAGLEFRFRGRRVNSQITGHLEWTRAGTGAVVESGQMTMRPLGIAPGAASRATTLDGVYSNIEYSEAGGDLLGRELVLIPDGDSTLAVLWEYEGAPQFAYPPARALITGDTVRFDIMHAPYVFVRSGSGLSFKGGQYAEELSRRSSVWEVMQKQPRFECS